MSQENSASVPLLDIAVLTRLTAESKAGHGIWRVYVRNFLAEAPLILKNLRTALTSGDIRGSLDSLLGLRTAGQLVGALRLTALTLNLEADVRGAADSRDPGGALPALAVLHLQRILRCAQKTFHKLEAALA